MITSSVTPNPTIQRARPEFRRTANPPYRVEHSGTVLVCGNASCLSDDLERSQSFFPDAPIIAVNGASREVKAFALFSQHPERFVQFGHEWIRRQNKFHYWWDIELGGGSAWGARKMAHYMGFDTVILCGCPLEIGNYASGQPGMLMTRKNVIDDLRFSIERDVKWHGGVYSMSGWTKEFLGVLPGC
ncbi:hypothetical protein LCGC14_3006910 [marine sediment metagenome]|uniref:Uncharacterized protein n=1 Tax=marine sediment metagenome TaxID=412755 RepID=A0A0F8ZQL1_9ZZZZ